MVFLTVILWIAFSYGALGLILFGLIKTKVIEGHNIFKGWIPVSIVSIIGLMITSSIVRIEAQEVGVHITPSGVKERPLYTGWYIIMPWHSVKRMDKTVWVYTCAKQAADSHQEDEGSDKKPKHISGSDEIWAPTKDGIKMAFDISVSWRIDPEAAAWIYENVSENDGGQTGRYYWLEEKVIRTKLKSALTDAVKNYTGIEAFSTGRQEIENKVFAAMQERVSEYHLIIDGVDLRESYFTADYQKALDNKKLAEQEVLRLVEVTRQQEEKLKQAEINKNIQIEQAKGEAEALRVKSEAINSSPKVLTLEWINKWDGTLPTTILSDEQQYMIQLQK